MAGNPTLSQIVELYIYTNDFPASMLDYWTLAYLFQLKRSNKIWFEGPRRFWISKKNYWTKSVGVNQDINSWRVDDLLHLGRIEQNTTYTHQISGLEGSVVDVIPRGFLVSGCIHKKQIGGKNPHTASLDPLPKLRDVGGKNTWWMLLMVLESGKLTSWVLENLPFVH